MPLVKNIPGYKALYRGNVLLWKSGLQITARVYSAQWGTIVVIWKASSDEAVFQEMASKGKAFVLTQNGVSKLMRTHSAYRGGRQFRTNGTDEQFFTEGQDVVITLEE